MNTMLQPGRVLFAAAMIALGITGLVNGDFALVWQHVPAGLPGRTVLAYLCAAIEVAVGLGLLFERTRAPASRVLFPYMLLWVILLEVPKVIRAPLAVESWGSIGEIGTMLAGAWCLFAAHAGTSETRGPGFAAGAAGIRAARWWLVFTLPMLAAGVIVPAVNIGDPMMQPWLQALPHPAAWAILSGAGSIAACLGILFGIWPRLAATLEAVMVAVIGIAYWGPDLYTGRTATTAFIITFLVAAGVWVVADTYRSLPWFAMGHPVWRKGATWQKPTLANGAAVRAPIS